tara:strand:- start:390 stop:779 length:390 start_codon:yes stop_codon:yes gene_type:complete
MKPNFTPLWRTNVNDDNKLIADFIGFKPCLTSDPNGNKIYVGTETPFGWQYPDCYPEHDYLISVEDLKFNTSWDWLMLVIRECNSLDLDNRDKYVPSFDKIILPSMDTWDINEVYKAVVKFIEEYYLYN